MTQSKSENVNGVNPVVMTIGEKTINCKQYRGYQNSKRIEPFSLAYVKFDYLSDPNDKKILDRIFLKGQELAEKVNPAAANQSKYSREKERLLNNAAAGILAEYCWRTYLNHKADRNIVNYTPYTAASTQIDLIVLSNNKLIEVRSSFPRNGIVFSICSENYEFDILGPYSNSVKPSEIQKDFYTRTLYHVPTGRNFIDMAKKDGFKVYLTGGATWQMMVDENVSKNKDLLPEDAISIAEDERSTYRVVPFSKALDTKAILDLINQ